MSFIELYQQDLLKKHIEYFPGNSKMSVSDINEISETYDTIGIVDASFMNFQQNTTNPFRISQKNEKE